jgi:2-polyprenyl-3-methyl-5-hydroxy-6-metoxy-1,4-benzoquinol methylase
MNDYAVTDSKLLQELSAIKAKHKAAWEDGDYANFAKYMQSGAVEVLESWKISVDKKLLDVGCGAGQTAIPAAKSGIDVTGIDLAENLISYAIERAHKNRLNAHFDVGDAENLPYQDHSYDVIISMFGAMFAPRPDQVVNEFARVLKPGGQLIMANWTPQGMPAQMFKTVSSYVPPPTGSVPPVLWGDESTVEERLGKNFDVIELNRCIYPQWEYPFDADDLVTLFRTYFGPVKKAFDSVNEEEKLELHEKLKAIYEANSIFKNGVLTITGGEYLEVKATRH